MIPDPRMTRIYDPDFERDRMKQGVGVTLNEAAAVLGITAATLRQQIARGRLKATKRGRDWWVTRAEVERYRREHRRCIDNRTA